jgi:hypothetical protein
MATTVVPKKIQAMRRSRDVVAAAIIRRMILISLTLIILKKK